MLKRRMVSWIALFAWAVLGWQLVGADRMGRHSFEAREAARLRRHFAVVERALLGRDVSDLSPARLAARGEQVRLLRRYADAGAFPQNDSFPGKSVPFFRDRRGNLCAMAFLIAASGRGDIVDHVARTRNNADVPDLVDEPGLAAWLDQHGLTVAEAARIQPTYGGYTDPNAVSKGYFAASVAAGGVSAVSMVWNARSMDRLAGHRTRTLVGLAANAVNLGLGLAYIGSEGHGARPALGAANLVVGAAAAILGVRALSAKPRIEAATSSRLRVVPIATGGTTPRFGFMGNLRF